MEGAKPNNQMGDNPTVEHTSPETLYVINSEKKKLSIHKQTSACDPALGSLGQNSSQFYELQQNAQSPSDANLKLTKQSAQSTISAFKPFGVDRDSPGTLPSHL